MGMPTAIAARLAEVRQRIDAACRRAGRPASEVELVAVSKTFPADAVMAAHSAGQTCFGESRLQEAEPKIARVGAAMDWHFIGRVQRNKVRRILALFGVVHGIDSLKLAAHADRVAGELGLRLGVFLQVNIGHEASKGGFEPDVLGRELDSLLGMGNLRILGLMCIPPAGPDAESSRCWFTALRELRDGLVSGHGADLPGLSMGMSGDYEVAIEEGATHVRVGSAIFGERG